MPNVKNFASNDLTEEGVGSNSAEEIEVYLRVKGTRGRELRIAVGEVPSPLWKVVSTAVKKIWKMTSAVFWQ